LEPVQLGESTQWIRIRAASARNPLLLLVQLGPGLPIINEARTFGRLLSLEDRARPADQPAALTLAPLPQLNRRRDVP